MMFKAILAVAALAGGLFFPTAANAIALPPDTVVTATFHNHLDSGNHGDWARDNFTRTTTIHATAPGAFTVTTVDHGTFTAGMCAHCSPNAGKAITLKVMGAFDGGEVGTANGTVDPAKIAAVNGQTFDDQAATHYTQLAWFQQLFADGVTGTPYSTSWGWAYKTADEQWADTSTNGDGALPADGDITGKITSVLKAQGVCKGSTTATWNVTSIAGPRSRTFGYRVWAGGHWTATASASVSAGLSHLLVTKTGTTLALRYWDGYGVLRAAYAKRAINPC